MNSDQSIEKVSIRFPGVPGNEANGLATSLTEALRNLTPPVAVDRFKDDPNTQDMGTVLTIILGSAPAAAIAAGMASWMRMRRVKVQITTNKETVEVSGDGANAAKIIESVFKR
jgi:Effector Associated Constant Component 1